MFGGQKSGGYTIVELMMFLAVTGTLFIIAVNTIAGKQDQANFAQGARGFHAQIEDIINDISTGYFPGQGKNFECGYNGGQGQPIQFITSPVGESGNSIGQHHNCVLLGKVLYFDFLANPNGASNYSVLSIAGSRATDQNIVTQNLYEAHPIPLDGNGSSPNFTSRNTINNAVSVTDIITFAGVGNGSEVGVRHPAAVGIFASLPEFNGGVTSGALTTNIIAIPASCNGIGCGTADNASATRNKIISLDQPANPTTINPVVAFCLKLGGGRAGGSGKKAAVIIGGTGDRQTYSEIHIDNYASAVDLIDGVADSAPTCP